MTSRTNPRSDGGDYGSLIPFNNSRAPSAGARLETWRGGGRLRRIRLVDSVLGNLGEPQPG